MFFGEALASEVVGGFFEEGVFFLEDADFAVHLFHFLEDLDLAVVVVHGRGQLEVDSESWVIMGCRGRVLVCRGSLFGGRLVRINKFIYVCVCIHVGFSVFLYK